jgi:Brp/Blh family beta-carotene 15,15'-monooxygenase
MLFGLNSQESISVIADLTGYTLQQFHFTYTSIVSAILWVVISIFLFYKNHKAPSFWIQEVFFLLVLALIFKTASLLWSFAIYFTIWHSLPSLLSQLFHLYGQAGTKEIYKYVKSSLIYWIGAIFFLALLFYFLQDYMDRFLSILVAFLAAITLPHSFVMSKMFNSRNKK